MSSSPESQAARNGAGDQRFAMAAATRIFVRPIGSPLPLGFFAFATGTFIFSMYEIGAIPVSEGHDVALLLLGAIFPLQLISGVFAFLGRDTPGATAISFLAGS